MVIEREFSFRVFLLIVIFCFASLQVKVDFLIEAIGVNGMGRVTLSLKQIWVWHMHDAHSRLKCFNQFWKRKDDGFYEVL